jgi:putative endonuclease
MEALSGFAYTYVLRLTNGQWYIGSTEDIDRRLAEHIAKAGGRTTGMYDGELVYVEACRSIVEARAREKQLKTGYGRAYLQRRLSFETR